MYSIRATMVASALLIGTNITQAGPVLTFTDVDAFRAAAGDVREIDFETLPDGSPSVFNTAITPDFNYTDQGVTFSSPIPELLIEGTDLVGFSLFAAGPKAFGVRNWIIADLVIPATAIGVQFPGSTTLSLLDTSGGLISSTFFANPDGTNFGGVISDVPIGSATVDRGLNVEAIDTFLFTPVPEPTTLLLLLGAGGAILMRRRR